MKERIFLTIDDLNNYEKTLKSVLDLFEKILIYYEEKNINDCMAFITQMTTCWILIYNGMTKKEGENNAI